jgi:hypothetical protein
VKQRKKLNRALWALNKELFWKLVLIVKFRRTNMPIYRENILDSHKDYFISSLYNYRALLISIKTMSGQARPNVAQCTHLALNARTHYLTALEHALGAVEGKGKFDVQTRQDFQDWLRWNEGVIKENLKDLTELLEDHPNATEIQKDFDDFDKRYMKSVILNRSVAFDAALQTHRNRIQLIKKEKHLMVVCDAFVSILGKASRFVGDEFAELHQELSADYERIESALTASGKMEALQKFKVEYTCYQDMLKHDRSRRDIVNDLLEKSVEMCFIYERMTMVEQLLEQIRAVKERFLRMHDSAVAGVRSVVERFRDFYDGVAELFSAIAVADLPRGWQVVKNGGAAVARAYDGIKTWVRDNNIMDWVRRHPFLTLAITAGLVGLAVMTGGIIISASIPSALALLPVAGAGMVMGAVATRYYDIAQIDRQYNSELRLATLSLEGKMATIRRDSDSAAEGNKQCSESERKARKEMDDFMEARRAKKKTEREEGQQTGSAPSDRRDARQGVAARSEYSLQALAIYEGMSAEDVSRAMAEAEEAERQQSAELQSLRQNVGQINAGAQQEITALSGLTDMWHRLDGRPIPQFAEDDADVPEGHAAVFH